MDAALRFGRGHALHAMDAALVTQFPENRFAGDFENRFLQPAELGRTGFEVFDLKPGRFRVAVVHPVKIGGENSGLAAAGAGANFHDRVAIVGFIGRQKRDLDLEFQIGDAFFERRDFFLRHLREIGVRGGGEFAIVFQLPARGYELLPFREQLLDRGMLAHGIARLLPVVEKVRIGDLAFQLLEAFPFARDEGLEVHKQKRRLHAKGAITVR